MAPRGLGALLLIAGSAYVFDTLAYTLLPNYSDNEAAFTAIVAVPAVIAEAGLTIWLLRRAGRPSLFTNRGDQLLAATSASGQ